MRQRKCSFIPAEYGSVTELTEQICKAAEKTNADTIVMGNRGLSGIPKLLLGSVSASVLNECTCTTTIVKLPPDARETAMEDYHSFEAQTRSDLLVLRTIMRTSRWPSLCNSQRCETLLTWQFDKPLQTALQT